MPEPRVEARTSEILGRAHRIVVAGQADLAAHIAVRAGTPQLCAIVERVAVDVAALVPDNEEREPRQTLLGWRDTLSSYVHAALALDDLEVDAEVAAHLLERGLASLVLLPRRAG